MIALLQRMMRCEHTQIGHLRKENAAGHLTRLDALHGPKSVHDAAEVALHDADQMHVLNAGATAVVDNSDQAKQQGRQWAAAAQQLQPFVAQVNLVLHRSAYTPALRQHGPKQRRPLHNKSRHAAAPEHDESGCGGEHRGHAVAEHVEVLLQRR
jgi:hypothetical protein